MHKWFVSPSGRKFSQITTAVVIASASSSYMFCHTFLREKYKNFLQLYHNGLPVKVSEELEEKTRKIIDDCQVDIFVNDNYELFSIYGFDASSIGSFNLRKGVYIGLPKHFQYKTSQDIEKRNIKISQNNIKWSSEAGEKLAESLILSEAAKEFAIAREVNFCNTFYIPFHTSIIAAFGIIAYTIGYAINNRWNLYIRPAKLRYLIYTLNTAFNFLAYVYTIDAMNFRYELAVDEKTAGLGVNYLHGGLEYYEKMIQRNIALRTLMEDLGPKKYTIFGNKIEMFRTQHVPVTSRRDFFANKLNVKKKSEL